MTLSNELAARAAYEAHQKGLTIKDDIPWDELGDPERERWADIAAAVLRALNEAAAGVKVVEKALERIDLSAGKFRQAPPPSDGD